MPDCQHRSRDFSSKHLPLPGGASNRQQCNELSSQRPIDNWARKLLPTLTGQGISTAREVTDRKLVKLHKKGTAQLISRWSLMQQMQNFRASNANERKRSSTGSNKKSCGNPRG
jgi:hypothetical protein